MDKTLFYTEKELESLGIKFGEDVRISKQSILTRPKLLTVGTHVAIDPFVYISPKTEIGNYVHIAPFVGIAGTSQSKCKIGDYTTIAQGCKLIVSTEDYTGASALMGPTIPLKHRSITHGETILERFVALAVNVTVFPNITIHEGAVVGACSLVTHDLDSWGIYYGVPARYVKNRRNDLILKYARELELNAHRLRR